MPETHRDTPELSALITCYYEEKTVEEFHRRLSEALEGLGRSYEIIFVNDGSTDKTFERLEAIFEKDPHVSVILDLFKNAGQGAAITAAFCESSGRVILSMDSDMQLDPAELPDLIAAYDAGTDVVSGCRTSRSDSLFRIIPSKAANIIMRRASRTNFHDFGCTFKLYNAKLLRAFELGPWNIFNPVTVIAQADRCIEVPVSHRPRSQGKSGWTFRKLWNYQMEHVVSLTAKPFQYMGGLAVLLAMAFFLRIVIDRLTPFTMMAEVTNGLLLNAVAITFLLLFAALCMIGEFCIRTFLASQHVPKYIVRERIGRGGKEA